MQFISFFHLLNQIFTHQARAEVEPQAPLLPAMVKSSQRRKAVKSINTKKQHFKGVRMRKWGKWVSEVRVPTWKGKGKIWLGSYDSPEQAARAYDCALYCLRGSRANFNFPQFLPEIPSASSLSPAQIKTVASRFGKEGFKPFQPLDCDATFSGLKSQLGVHSSQGSEEHDLGLLDSLLREVESFESSIAQDFLPLDELFEDTDFLEEMEGSLEFPISMCNMS